MGDRGSSNCENNSNNESNEKPVIKTEYVCDNYVERGTVSFSLLALVRRGVVGMDAEECTFNSEFNAQIDS